MKIISLAAIAMVRGQNNEISFFDERERERGGGRRDCPTFVENICSHAKAWYLATWYCQPICQHVDYIRFARNANAMLRYPDTS